MSDPAAKIFQPEAKLGTIGLILFAKIKSFPIGSMKIGAIPRLAVEHKTASEKFFSLYP
jgi:hypothetical protein